MSSIKDAPSWVQNKIERRVHQWTKVGQDVQGLQDPREIAEKAQLNWEANKYPILKPNGSECSNIQLLIREDTGDELTVCPKNWSPLSNIKFIERGQEIASRVEGELIRAGFIQKGGEAKERLNLVWALIKVGDRFLDEAESLPESMHFSPYICINNCHNYGYGLSINAFFVRLVCSNGMLQQTKIAKKFTHTGSSKLNAQSADQLKQSIKEYLEQINGLANTFMSEQQAYMWLAAKYGKADKPFHEQPVKFQMVWNLYQGAYDQDFAEFGIDLGQRSPEVINTAYGLLQAVVAYENHFGLGSLDGKLISLWREEAATEIRKVQEQLNAIALKRKQKEPQQVSVGFRR